MFVLDHDGSYKSKLYGDHAITYGSLLDNSHNVIYLWDIHTGHQYAKINTRHNITDVMYWDHSLYYSTGKAIYIIKIHDVYTYPREYEDEDEHTHTHTGIGHITYDPATFKQFTHDKSTHADIILHEGHIITQHWDGYLSIIDTDTWHESRYYEFNGFEFPKYELSTTRYTSRVYPLENGMLSIFGIVEKYVEQHGEVRTNEHPIYEVHNIIITLNGEITFQHKHYMSHHS